MESLRTTHEHRDAPAVPVDRQPIISQSWKWTTVIGNALIGIGEIASGQMSTLSVTADGLHNAGDAVSYYIQADTILNRSLSEAARNRRRTLAHWIIMAGSLGVAAKAGLDLRLGHETTPNMINVYAAGASLALNTGMLAGLYRGRRRARLAHDMDAEATVYEHDLAKHFWAVDIPSAGLAVVGAVAQKHNIMVEQCAAVISGVVGAWIFRPTPANLHHDHHGSHVHGQHHDGWFAKRQAVRRSRREAEAEARWQRWVAQQAAGRPQGDPLGNWAKRTLAGKAGPDAS